MGYPRRKAKGGASYTSFVELRACASGCNLSSDPAVDDLADFVGNLRVAKYDATVLEPLLRRLWGKRGIRRAVASSSYGIAQKLRPAGQC